MKQYEKKKETYASEFSEWAFVLGFMLSIAAELVRPQLASFSAYLVVLIFGTLLASGLGWGVDAYLSFQRKRRAPLEFIDFLSREAREPIRDIIRRHLAHRANVCVEASADMIRFQAEELSNNGRAAPTLSPEQIEQTRSKLDEGVKGALKQFYEFYDRLSPYFGHFGVMAERSFKAYATSSEQHTAELRHG